MSSDDYPAKGVPRNAIVFGRGLLAQALRKSENLNGAFFATGVSNSISASCEDYLKEEREILDFIDRHQEERIFYFSSFVAINGEGTYAQHKRVIEEILIKHAKRFLIVRLPQVVGVARSNTLINSFVSSVRAGRQIKIQRYARRRLIDVEDVARILEIISNCDYPATGINVGPLKSLTAEAILLEICEILGARPNYLLSDLGESQDVSLDAVFNILGGGDPIFAENYQQALLRKYVPLLFRDESRQQGAFKSGSS